MPLLLNSTLVSNNLPGINLCITLFETTETQLWSLLQKQAQLQYYCFFAPYAINPPITMPITSPGTPRNIKPMIGIVIIPVSRQPMFCIFSLPLPSCFGCSISFISLPSWSKKHLLLSSAAVYAGWRGVYRNV